jgi:Holliday junction resolvase RusA-like endonuclease
MKITIPMKLPSLNNYINACRTNKYMASSFKKNIQSDIKLFLKRLPEYKTPVFITFTWVEENKKRDLDNVCFAKKFILDAMQELGKIPNDNQKYIKGFTDLFEYGDMAKVIVEVEEIK